MIMNSEPSWLKNHVPAPPHRWPPGTSGNVKGRPAGTPNRRTLAAKTLLEEIGAVLNVLISKAKAGDVAAAGLLLGRVIPTLRPRAETVQFALDTKGSLVEQGEQVLQAMADGSLDPDTAKQILDSISAFAGLRQVDELAERIAKLEQRDGSVNNETKGGVLWV